MPGDQDPTRIPNVQRVRRADGRLDLYFRKGAHHRPLRSADHTPELRAEVEAILVELRALETAQRPRPATVGACLAAYNRSAEFLALGFNTQGGYQSLIDELTDDLGEVLLADVDGGWVRELRDAWALRGHRAANTRLQVLKNALDPAVDDGRLAADPFARLKKVRRPHDAGEAHPVWTDEEVAAAIEDAITRDQPGLARAVALARWGGFRRQTVCALPHNARLLGADSQGRQERRLYWVTEKRKVLADKREDARLTALLARTPDRAITVAYNRRSQPWKERQLNQALTRLLDRLAAEGRVRGVTGADGVVACPLTIHGLRHARGVELAIAGASDAEIMAQLEHATDRAAKIYRRQAERRRLADAGQDRLDNVIELRERRSRAHP